jgi:hypothetical protein
MASSTVSEEATYSVAVVDLVTIGCILVAHTTGEPSKMMARPETDQPVMMQFA